MNSVLDGKYIVDENGCWVWQRHTARGYGYVRFMGKFARAHRVSYLLANGDLPPVLDHLCRNRACINPQHLEPCTAKENIHRGMGLAGINHRKTRCNHGHLFDARNTIIMFRKNGRVERHCRTCKNIRSCEIRKRRKASKP